MKILEKRETWIHTHFLTDCVRLPSIRMREIRGEMTPFLKGLSIVYGIHFEHHEGEKGIRIVLECRPFESTSDQIHKKLEKIIKNIPARPQEVRPRLRGIERGKAH